MTQVSRNFSRSCWTAAGALRRREAEVAADHLGLRLGLVRFLRRRAPRECGRRLTAPAAGLRSLRRAGLSYLRAARLQASAGRDAAAVAGAAPRVLARRESFDQFVLIRVLHARSWDRNSSSTPRTRDAASAH